MTRAESRAESRAAGRTGRRARGPIADLHGDPTRPDPGAGGPGDPAEAGGPDGSVRRAQGRRSRIGRGPAVAGTALAAAGAGVGAYAVLRRNDGSTDLSAAAGAGTPQGAIESGNGTVVDSTTGSAAAVAKSLVLPAGLDTEHLLRRVTYGATDALRQEVRRRGAAAWLAEQLAPASLADPAGDAVVALFPRLRLSGADAAAQVTDAPVFGRELAAAHLARAIWSKRQLFELMVDLWSNHFNITVPGDKAQLTRHRFDNDVVRRHALGRFEDLLQASAIHPAMLEFLDNAQSSGQNPNENYARELLEQHTVGTGFTERDVKQAALLLTGYQVRDGAPHYVPSRHHVGAVSVLGFSHPNGSRAAGREATQGLLRHLARHPSTATRLATRLAVRFVSDGPSKALVARLAQVYLASDTAIVPVLTELFTSAEFAASGGAKLRRPMEQLAATVRVLGLAPGKQAQPLIDLYWMLDASGHRPLGWPLPDGYPDVATSWRSPAATLAQFNASAQLAHGWWPKGLVNPGLTSLVGTAPATRAAAVDAIGGKLLGRRLTAAERAAANKLLAASQLPTNLRAGSWEQKETLGLVATLILNSPAHLSR